MRYVVKLSRPALEIATFEIEAKTENDAANLAFKVIDGVVTQDIRVMCVTKGFKADEEELWEEEYTRTVPTDSPAESGKT